MEVKILPVITTSSWRWTKRQRPVAGAETERGNNRTTRIKRLRIDVFYLPENPQNAYETRHIQWTKCFFPNALETNKFSGHFLWEIEFSSPRRSRAVASEWSSPRIGWSFLGSNPPDPFCWSWLFDSYQKVSVLIFFGILFDPRSRDENPIISQRYPVCIGVES